jgi:hypothetical protein
MFLLESAHYFLCLCARIIINYKAQEGMRRSSMDFCVLNILFAQELEHFGFLSSSSCLFSLFEGEVYNLNTRVRERNEKSFSTMNFENA